MIKIKLNVSTNKVGSRETDEISVLDLGYNEETWFKMSADRRREILDDYFNEWVWENIDAWYEIEE